MERSAIRWEDPRLKGVDPGSFTCFYPNVEPPKGLRHAVKKLGWDTIIAAYGYGSTFSGDASSDSLVDLCLVVTNPQDFHRLNAKRGYLRYGKPRTAEFHAWLNSMGANFYHGSLPVDQYERDIKVGVIGYETFLHHARGGRMDAMQSGEGAGYLYLPGRLHKAMWMPVLDETTPQEKEQLDKAINQARIDGVWLALGLLPRNFSYDDLANKYVQLSYLADRRVEKANKPQLLLEGSKKEYQEMLGNILDQFILAGVVELTGKGYQSNYALSSELVEEWIKKAKKYATRTNYIHNPAACGLVSGALYSLAKIRRARAHNKLMASHEK